MKDAGKWRFAKHLCNAWGEDSIVTKDTLIDPVLIYDGGMLVHELISLWIRGKTLGAIADNYVSYLTRITRGTCEIIVVMDGYLGISTKGHTQRKRNPTQSLDFVVQNDTVLDVSAIVFLSNPSNKQGFVDFLSEKINTRSRLTAKKCSGDADRSMVTTALETVELHKPVILKADDTDVLVMCLAESQTNGLFLERGGKVYTIEQFRSRIEPPLVRQNVVIFHAFFGCDITSGFFAYPSYNASKTQCDYLAEELEIFRDSRVTTSDIHEAGVKLVAALYGCDTDLNQERVRLFRDRCNDRNKKRMITLERLPPTADAVKLHAERAYLQIQEWQDNSLDPESFGWKMVEGVLEPVPMRQAPAPPFLLDVKKCGCSTGGEGGRCSCLGNGLPCTNKCTCIDCKNPKNIFNTSEDVYHTVPEDYSEDDESMHELDRQYGVSFVTSLVIFS